jgi:hypothetical protein
MRTFFAAACLLCLTACGQPILGRFESKTPLFRDSRGECPFARETILTEWSQEESGKTAWGASTVYTPEGNHCVTRASSDAEAVHEQRLFVPIAGNVWIVQAQDAEARPSYSIARRNGDRLEFYGPVCADFDAQTLVGAGVSYSPPKPAPVEKPTEAEPAPIQDKPTTATSSAGQPPRKPSSELPTSGCTATRADGLERLFRTWWSQGRKPDWTYRPAPP